MVIAIILFFQCEIEGEYNSRKEDKITINIFTEKKCIVLIEIVIWSNRNSL